MAVVCFVPEDLTVTVERRILSGSHAEGSGASVDNDGTHLCHNFMRSDPDLSNFGTIWP